jgi:Peptidase family M23
VTVVRNSLCVLLALPALAQAQAAPELSLPLDCEIGKACIVQNYVDRDPGPGARDYRCGSLSYDGHKGTDIRVIDARAYERGVAVVAAAPGRVRAVRDGMRDVSVRVGRSAVAGREAGNSVVIDHGGGWETQYAHLRRGSVAVRPGETVETGGRLGTVGLSGKTEFPHLHFEVRRDRAIVDPFVGLNGERPCAGGEHPLWRAEAGKALAYVATGVLGAGIAGGVPVASDGAVDSDGTVRFAGATPAAVFWVQIYGARAGDTEAFRLVAPDGRVLAEKRTRIERTQAQRLSYVGKRRSGAAWPAGAYRGEYAVYRGREKVVSLTREVSLESGPAVAARGGD